MLPNAVAGVEAFKEDTELPKDPQIMGQLTRPQKKNPVLQEEVEEDTRII